MTRIPTIMLVGCLSVLHAVANPVEIGFFELGKRVETSFQSGNGSSMRAECYVSELTASQLVVSVRIPQEQQEDALRMILSKVPSSSNLTTYILKVKTVLKEKGVPIADCRLSQAKGTVIARDGVTGAESIEFTFLKGREGFSLHFDMAQHIGGKWVITDGPHGWVTIYGGKQLAEKVELK